VVITAISASGLLIVLGALATRRRALVAAGA
jgi:hypothetical protein